MTVQRLIVIVGPTGVGKSAIAMQLAQDFGQPLFYFEPVLAYRELSIGSAKPTQEDRTRVTHYGIDLTTLHTPITLMDFYRQVVPILSKQIMETGMGIVVTGSGFFLRALLQGVPVLHERGPGFVRKEAIFTQITGIPYDIKNLSPPLVAACYQRLQNLWPLRAALIHPHDAYRILRSLEVAVNAFPTMPDFVHHTHIEAVGLVSLLPKTIRPYIFGIYQEPQTYEQRLRDRIQKMLEAGFSAEVANLIRAGFPLQGALASVGYRQMYLHLTGYTYQVGETISERIFYAHRQLSHKQMRWFFRLDQGIWLNHTRFGVSDLVSEIFQIMKRPITMKKDRYGDGTL